ncbi:PREDICTED: set1/Ash2 histone methyltransferase complex subunit ASH2 isoform X3 [Bactrocera latifrons]|uniref:set1/Ash2 histone methyltransferase complex subunit ASH2 isoform X3 n=1 Tax=Bactrocera latifrons TaxID=174628 RepID=UPI0008DCAB6D|nr:PREDICTED: set1/Ash2 histone methyltransferase complex subunit ASH2 isoform X3 [Bactrocera latifrons]
MDEIQTDTNSQSETASEYASSERAAETTREEKPASGANNAGICYCGKERNLNIVELLCANCSRWFHESCIGYQLGKLVPFISNYMFVCKNCSQSGLEIFRKSQATIPQMCVTAIANMQQNALKDGKSKFLFSKDKEIIPYIEQYWEAMTTMPRRVTQSWYSTVQRSLVKEVNILFTYEENAETGAMFGLVTQDLSLIKPNYDTMASSLTKNNRQNKRKLPGNDSGPTGKKGRPSSDITANVKLPAHGYPLEHPFNKDGYRYILAEPDPHAPFRQEFDESSDWAGKPIPGWLYRTLVPNCVLLALHDRAPQLKVSEDRLAVTGEKGYCMVRATHSVNRGRWYFEAVVEEMPEGAATRMGWGQEYGNLQAPLGYDKFGYSWRSRKGTRFHESHGKHYSDAYAEGDVLGFLIDLPDETDTNYLPNTFKDRPLVKFKSHLYYEDKDKVQETLKGLKVLPGSTIEYFKNGKSQGVAFTDIYGGSYYPTISIHKNATVAVNFGPNFKHPEVLNESKAKGMCERVEELISEQCLSDIMYLTENDGKLRLDNFNFSKLK